MFIGLSLRVQLVLRCLSHNLADPPMVKMAWALLQSSLPQISKHSLDSGVWEGVVDPIGGGGGGGGGGRSGGGIDSVLLWEIDEKNK